MEVSKSLKKRINVKMCYNVGYPQYNNAKEDLLTIAQAPFIEKPIRNSFEFRLLTPKSTFSILPYLNDVYSDVLSYITKKFELLETSYNHLTERLKEFIESKFLKRIYNILIQITYTYLLKIDIY